MMSNNRKKHQCDRMTQNRCNIEKRIKDGLTLIFENELQARDNAKQMRSYYYPVYMNSKTTGEYAVPK